MVSVGVNVAVITEFPTLPGVATEFPLPLRAIIEALADEYEKVPAVLLIGAKTVAVSPNLIVWLLQERIGSPLPNITVSVAEIEVPLILNLYVVFPKGMFEKPKCVNVTMPATAVAVSCKTTAPEIGLLGKEADITVTVTTEELSVVITLVPTPASLISQIG